MEGGLFDLDNSQKIFLYCAHFLPVIITYITLTLYNDLLTASIVVQLFYVVTSMMYIRLISKEQEMAPYLINELRSIRLQCQKGLSLGLSAFLLITIYTIIILKLGRVVLPKHLDFGEVSHHYWPIFLIVGVTNPILEEWYWRLFLPKVHGWTHLDHQAHLYQGADHQHLLPAVSLYPIQSLSGLLEINTACRSVQ